jgi:regulatory protein
LEKDKVKIRAKNNAYALLRQRPRSEAEIRTRLKLKGYAAGIIDGVVEDLRRTGSIDDAKFARFWVESRMHANPMGDVVLRHELKQKGVADPIVEAALEDKGRNYDEYEVALGMASDRFERLKKLDAPTPSGTDPDRSRRVDKRKALKRLYDFLIRRGFKYDTVQKVVDALIGSP